MRDELELSLRDLEARLPELRRLIAESEVQLAVSEEAQTWGDALVRSAQLTGELASSLRRVLLRGVSEVAPPPSPTTPPEVGHSEIESDLERVLNEIDTEAFPAPRNS